MPTDRISGFNMGVSVKVACQAATTGANITLSGSQTIDGISVGSAQERVLVKDQTSSITNGIYVADSSTWIRARDCDGNKDLLPGSLVYVDRGTVNQRSFWVFNSSSTATSITVGTDAITANDVTAGLGVTPSAWTETNLFPLTSASSARSVIGAFPTTSVSTWVEVNFLTVASASAGRSALSAAGATQINYIDAKAYGCVGNNITNDTTNMQAALSAAASGILFIPPGTYKLTSQLTLDNSAVSIIGSGPGVCELRWYSSAASAGINITPNLGSKYVHVSGLRLTTQSTATNTIGLTVDYSTSIFDHGGGQMYAADLVSPRTLIDNVIICGSSLVDSGSYLGNGFETGIKIKAAIGMTIRDTSIIGMALNAYQPVFGNGSGVIIVGTPETGAYENGHPAIALVENCNIWYHGNGAAFLNVEGAYVSHSNIVGCNTGVWTMSTNDAHNQVTIDNNHINSYSVGVLIDGNHMLSVAGNTIFHIQTSSGGIGVNITGGGRSGSIIGNNFLPFGNSAQGMYIDNASHISIMGNAFEQNSTYMETCIGLSTNSSKCKVMCNTYNGTFNSLVTNTGSSNIIPGVIAFSSAYI